MSIDQYNGSAIVAMAGKDCVAIASDLRFGVQMQTMATDHQKVMQIHDRLFIGLSGLATDQETLFSKFQFRHNMYKLREERSMEPETFANLVSNILYEKRFGPFFCQPVIAGLGKQGKPYLCGMDSIGAMETAKDFMAPQDLFEATAQALLAGVDRDALAGWGAVVYLITMDGVTARTLKGRMD